MRQVTNSKLLGNKYIQKFMKYRAEDSERVKIRFHRVQAIQTRLNKHQH